MRGLIVHIYIYLILLLISNSSFADYRHFLFIPQTQTYITAPAIDVNDNTQTASATVSGGPTGEQLAKLVWRECSGTDDNVIGTQDKTTWLITPTKVIHNGITIGLSVLSYNGWSTPNQAVPSGYSSKVYQEVVSGQKLYGCWGLNTNLKPVMIWRNAIINISIPKQSILPGNYRIPVKYYYAFEENKFTSWAADAYNIPSTIINSPGSSSVFYLNLNVQSVCKIDGGNSKAIDLSHGVMAVSEADGNKTLPYNLRLNCNPGTSVSVKLTGAIPVQGKTRNFTNCGSGSCELNFNGNEYDKVVKVNDSGVLDIPITSTFHLNKDEVVEGPFSGSAVFTFLIN
ncbi:hypothetical protein [Pseudomonas graminis]